MNSFTKMTSNKQQLTFNPEFIFSSIKEWKEEAEKYDQAAHKYYTKIRSYLTLWQFRLNDDTKCDIREKLAQHLDEITDHDFVEDLDSFLEGFCFQLDTTVMPNHTKEKNRKSAPSNTPQHAVQFSDSETASDTIDYNDLDFYTQQFFQ